MSKGYRPRLIDIRRYRERLATGGLWHLTVAELDGDPVAMNVETLICDGITVTDNGDGSVVLTGGAGGGGSHGAHYSLPIPATVLPPGPKNLSGGDWTIKAVNYISDGAVDATILGVGAISIAAGGNVDSDGVDVTDLSVVVADGSRLTVTGVTYPDPPDANYLAVTWVIESAV